MSNKERLAAFTDEALVAELAARRDARTGIPSPLPNPDFSKVQIIVVNGIMRAHEEQYQDDDLKAYVFEAAVEAVYGPGFWTWRNAQKW